MLNLHGTLKGTFKFPKYPILSNGEPVSLSRNDCTFVETEILRQFYINMSRVVPFRFAAYPEDRSINQKEFVGLHYHVVFSSDNDAKFIRVAPRKYYNLLASRFPGAVIPRIPLHLSKNVPGKKSYEKYSLKHYSTSIGLVTDAEFRVRSPYKLG